MEEQALAVDLEVPGRGTITLGINPGTVPGTFAKWWEWHGPDENLGGTWDWRFEPSMGGTRYVAALLIGGGRFVDLTHGRIAFTDEGPEPRRPWFIASDSGNGIPQPQGGPGPRRLMPGFQWRVAAGSL